LKHTGAVIQVVVVESIEFEVEDAI
jgi:hypothetical protein